MESIPLFLLASIVLIITPGPDLIYVLTRGIAQGKASGVVSAVGVTSGILFHTMAAALGVAVLLNTSAYAFWIVKVGGGVYLIYLGYKMIRDKTSLRLDGAGSKSDLKKCYLQGMLSNILNPKIALFFVAFLPQFVREDSLHHSLNMIALGVTFAVMTVALYAVLGLFAGSIGAWLKRRNGVAGKVRVGSGSVLVLLGLHLVTSQK